MATLYWGGGTGTWDGFTTTNWYTDLARTVLAGRAPAADDDVIFDSTSNATAYTVTIANNTSVCRNVTFNGPASGNLTIAGGGQLYVYGNLTFAATGLTRTYNGAFYIYGASNHTITTNGLSFANIFYFLGSGTYTLQDALTTTGQLIIVNGTTLNTNDKNLTCGNINTAIGTVAGILTLGASTVNATSISLTTAGLTINGGTSNITLSGATASIGNNSLFTGSTFYNVTFSSNALTTCNIYGNNTFNNLTFTTPAAVGISNVVVYGNQTISGTLTIAGQSGANRYFVRSDTIGTARTLTVATVATLTDVDFRDITVAGASSPWSGTRLGNCLGNTNITFGAGVNKYVKASTASSNWSTAIWATTSGNATGTTTDIPLAQDTVILDNAGMNTSAALTLDIAYNIGAVDGSSRTNAMTLAGSVSPSCYGSTNISTNITSTLSGGWTYAGRTTQNITSSGKAWAGITIDSPNGSVVLQDAYSNSIRAITLTNGTFNANNQNITCSLITANGSASKTLTLGSGTITSGIVGSSTAISNLTVTSTTATITSSGALTLGFNGITATFNGSISSTGAAQAITTYGTITVANLTLTAPTATVPTDKLVLGGDLTVTGTLALAGGTSVTQRAFVRSDTLGTQRTLSAATVTGLTDIDLRDIAATGAATWSGTRLGDCGGNSGITFPAAKTVYWNLAGTNNWSATAWTTASSGGTPDVNSFPLAQDTAVFDDNNTIGTVTMNASWSIGTISAGGRTGAWTLAGSGAPTIYGNVTYGSGITASITNAYTFSGRGTQTFTTAGKSLTNALTINKPTGTFQHGDAYTSTQSITVTLGAYTTQNYNINALNLISSNSNVRSIIFGTSTFTATGITPVNFANASGLIFNASSSTINLSSTLGKTFNGGGQIFGTVSSTGGTTNALTITGNNTFGTLTNSAYTYLIFTAGTTQTVNNFTYTGAAGNVVRWYTSIPGQRATLKAQTSNVGANSTNGGNNSGLTFTGTSPDYFYVKDIAYLVNYYGGSNFFTFF